MYLAQDSLSQRSKGVWRLSCHPVFDDGTCGEREYHTIHAETKREAKKAAGELRARLEEELRESVPQGVSTCGTTLYEYLRDYTRDMLATGVIRPTTAASYMQATKACASVAEKDMGLITEEDMKDCLANMLEDGRYGKNTAVKNFRTVRSALERACEEGLITKNPARRTKLPNLDKKRPRSLKTKERREIDELIGEIENPLKTAATLGLYMGLRGEEVCGLRWIDRDETFLTVNEVVAMEDGRPVLKEPKTPTSRRRLPEPTRATLALNARRREQEERCEKCGVKFSEKLFILGEIDGRPPSPDRLRKNFRAVCDAAGLSCTFHQLRHTFATRMVAQGVNPRTVAQWLGHSDPGFTLRVYCDADEGALMDSLAFVDSIVN